MATSYLATRHVYTNPSQVNTDALTLNAPAVSIGTSASSSKTNMTNGSYSSWQTAQTGINALKKTYMSSTGQYQLSVGSSNVYLSNDSGATWASLTAAGSGTGLPSSGNAVWSSGSISASGQIISLTDSSGGYVYVSRDYGASFNSGTPANVTPYSWIKMEGSITESGSAGPAATNLSVAGTTAAVTYTTGVVPGTQAVVLSNAAGGTANTLIRGAWPSNTTNFTVSFWMNMQSYSGSTNSQVFSSHGGSNAIYIGATGLLYWYAPVSTGAVLVGYTSTPLSPNTWYYVTTIFQTNGLCSFYVNNNLIASYFNGNGVLASSGNFSIGANDMTSGWIQAYNGYVDDFKIYTSAIAYQNVPVIPPSTWLKMENGLTDSGSQSAVQSPPVVYLPFEGSVVDTVGSTTMTVSGTPTYVSISRDGYTGQAINLANTAGGTAVNYVRGTWTGSPNFTVSFWMNPQTTTVNYQYVFSAYQSLLAIVLNSSGQLSALCPSGGGTNYATIGTYSGMVINTWYYITVIFQSNSLCSFYVNNTLVGSITNSSGLGTVTTSVFELSGVDTTQTSAYNGYMDDLRIYNYALPYTPNTQFAPNIWLPMDGTSANIGSDANINPVTWLPFDGTTADSKGVSTITTTGAFTYVSPALATVTGTQAVNISNTAGGSATNYIRGTWTGAANFTLSCWVNPQTLNAAEQRIVGAYFGYVLFFINTSNQLSFRAPTGTGTNNFTISSSTAATTNTWYHLLGVFQSNGTCAFYINGIQQGTSTNSGGFGTISSSGLFSVGCQDNAITTAYNGYVDDLRIYNSVVNYIPCGFTTGAIGYVQGPSTSQALNLTNTLGAGAVASQYLRGTWWGSPNWTVSFWFNMQSYSVAQGQSVIFSAYGGSLLIIIYNDSLSVWMDAGRRISTTSIPVTNTWYYVTYVHQTNGLCSLYLNNQLVGTYTKSGGLGTSLAFCLGTYDAALNSPFNGYIDDFRLYNTVVNNIPAIITVGNPTYVSGVVGSSALSLANTAGGTATQYVRAPWSGAPNFTVSFWFNPQTLNGVQQQVFAAYAGNFVIYISALNQVCIYVYNGTTSVGSTYAPTLSTNTWYFITAIFQSSGLSSFYVNNTLVGTFTSGLGSFTTTQFGLGCNDNSTVNAFNGYIDDVRIYPSAIPYSPMIASNYTACAVSGSGQYLLASSTTGRLLQSTDSGITWTHNTQGSGPHQSLTELALSHTGQYATSAIKKVVTPNTTAATALTYVHPSNGLTWTVSASSNYVAIGSQAYYALNDSPAVGWTSAANYSTAGVYNNTYSTTVQTGVGTSTAVAGEWIQIQSATPVTLTGFNFVAGYPGQVPSAYTICGSMNGQTWYLLQTGTFTANPITSTYGRLTTTITMNYTGTQSLKGDITTAAVTTTASQYTAGAYTYFRWIMPSTFATGSITTVAFGELYPQFQTATVQPQLTGLTTYNWQQNGIVYNASVSSTTGANYAYYAFNNTVGDSNGWASGLYYTGNTYNYSTTTVVQGGIGFVLGEFIQLQTSVPLVLTSYQLGGYATGHVINSYLIVGSTDGNTWYPIQSAVVAANPYSAFNQLASTILTNFTGTQAMIAGNSTTVSTTAYSTTTNAYTTFRLIGRGLFSGGQYMELSEWVTNFTLPTLASANSLLTWTANSPQHVTGTNVSDTTALSGSGQVMVQSTKLLPYAWMVVDPTQSMSTISPQLTGLNAYTWTQNGISWTASASSYYPAANLYAYGAFNNFYGGTGVAYSWASSNITNTYSPVSPYTYLGTTSTTIQGGIGAKAGEYLQIQTSVPLVLNSYTFACGGFGNLPKEYWIVGSTDGTTWYPLQWCVMTTNPLTTNFHTCTTYIQMNYTGVQTVQGDITGSGTTTAYSYTTQPYTYFRIIGIAPYNASGIVEIGEWFMNFVNPAGDIMGNSVMTVTGAPAYTQDRFGNVAGAINLANATGSGATATKYIVGTWPGSANFSVSFWMYPVTITGAQQDVITMYNGSLSIIIGATGYLSYYIPTGGSYAFIATSASVLTSQWYHVAFVFQTNGQCALYMNGSLVNAAINSGGVGANTSNGFYLGTWNSVPNMPYNGYMDDFRIYNHALNATQVAGLYNNKSSLQNLSIASNSLPAAAYTMVAALPAAQILSAASSMNGQIIVLTTIDTISNVYYTKDGGATWNNVTVPTTATDSIQGCAVSADGSYIIVNSNSASYTINTNTSAYGIAIGNKAGQYNQGQHAIAIGNCAAPRNQSASSIVLNATGQPLNAPTSGFYVAPIQPIGSLPSASTFASNSVNLLGYGLDDKQVVQSNIAILPYRNPLGYGNVLGFYNPLSVQGSALHVGCGYANDAFTILTNTGTTYLNYNAVVVKRDTGYMGIGTTAPSSNLHIFNQTALNATARITLSGFANSVGAGPAIDFYGWPNALSPQGRVEVIDDTYYGGWMVFSTKPDTGLSAPLYERMRIGGPNGYIGIGKTNPSYVFDVNGSLNCTGLLVNGTAVATGTGSVWGVSGSTISYTSGQVGIGTATPMETLGTYWSVNPSIGLHNSTSGYFQVGLASGTGAYSVSAVAGDSVIRAISGNLMLQTGSGAASIFINSSNNVGIGTANPSATLHINSTATYENSLVVNTAWPSIRLGYASSTGRDWAILNGGTGAGVGVGNLGIYDITSSNYRFCINSSGYVGIGSQAPQTKLVVNNFVTGYCAMFQAQGIIGGQTGGTVGIGKTDSAYNQATLVWNHIADGSASNYFGIGSHGYDNKLCVTAGGQVGIGNTGWSLYRLNVTSDGTTTNYPLNLYHGTNQVLAVAPGGTPSNGGFGATNTILFVGKDTVTNRSINALGTVNASGADYAEYFYKDPSMITAVIKKGDIVGITTNGQLTTVYDDAITFMIKSTDPSYIGGDIWATEAILGKRPDPVGPDASADETAQYTANLAAWTARFEEERQKVDRIAFAGQVPVNVLGAQPGDYIVPLRTSEGGITGQAVSSKRATFEQYTQAVGKVIKRLDDGRAVVIVKPI